MSLQTPDLRRRAATAATSSSVGVVRGGGLVRAALALAVLAVLTAVRLPWLHAPLVTQDEGIIVVYAQQILEGRLPQRDFYTVYGPGTFALTAGAFAVFGSSLVVERLLGLAFQALVVAGVFRLALGRGRTTAVAASLLSVLCLTPLGLAAYAWVGGLACIVWGLVLLERRRHLTAAFALLALSAVFRPEMAVPALAAGLPHIGSRVAWRSAVLGIVVGLAPSAAYYATWGRRAFDNVVLQRGLVNARMEIDGLTTVVLCVGAAALLALLVSAILVRSAESWSRLLLIALMVPQLVQRTDLDHLAYLMTLGAPFVLLAGFRPAGSGSPWSSWVARSAFVAALALLIVPSRLLVLPGPSATYEVGGRTMQVPAEQVSALDEVRTSVLATVPVGSRVFVGTQDMTTPSVTPVQLYFLLPELRADAYYLELPIGISPTVGRRIADDVRNADIILLSRFPRDAAHRLNPYVPPGPADADEAVRAGFCPAGGSDDLRIMVRCAKAST